MWIGLAHDRGVVEHDRRLRQRVTGLAAGLARAPDPREGQIQRLAVGDLGARRQQPRALQDDRGRDGARGQERAWRAQGDAGARPRARWPRRAPPRRALRPGRRAGRSGTRSAPRGEAPRSSARRCRCARRGIRPGSARSTRSRSTARDARRAPPGARRRSDSRPRRGRGGDGAAWRSSASPACVRISGPSGARMSG